MENKTKILVWHTGDDPQYYDVSTDDLLRGAALKIVEQRLERGIFQAPHLPEEEYLYNRNKKRIFNLEMVVGESRDEALEEMRGELEALRGLVEARENDYENARQEWESVIRCINTQDGALAVMIISNRMRNFGEKIDVFEASRVPNFLKESVEA